jgi:hypothetical protein
MSKKRKGKRRRTRKTHEARLRELLASMKAFRTRNALVPRRRKQG